jgi:putative transposase
VLDTHTRECLAASAALNHTGADVAAEFDRVIADRGVPAVIQSDIGSEFTGRTLDLWAYGRGRAPRLQPAGQTDRQRVIESFHRR